MSSEHGRGVNPGKSRPRSRVSWAAVWKMLWENWVWIFLFWVAGSDLWNHGPSKADFIIFGICGAFLLILPAISFSRRLTIKRAIRGHYQQALRLNRWFLLLPLYGGSLEGWILLEAGRYTEAEAVTRLKAFDESGNPRLTSWQLYYHAMALSHQGKWKSSQDLLERAIRVQDEIGHFHLGLADCLLEHNIDAERARELVERVQSAWAASSTSRGKAEKKSQRIGRHAWALARCSRRADAKERLQEAFAMSNGFESRDNAWLQYYAGETWRAVGEMEKARSAFQEALRAFPHGGVSLRSQKGLAELTSATIA